MIPSQVPGADPYARKTGFCWCGCGRRVDGKPFVSGHEATAVGTLLERSYGGVVEALLAHGRGPFASGWSYTVTEPEADEAVLAVNRARRAQPGRMGLEPTLDPVDLAWTEEDFRRWPLLRAIVDTGSRLTLTFSDPYEGNSDAHDAELAMFEQDDDQDVTVFSAVENSPVAEALDRFEDGGTQAGYAAELNRITATEPCDIDAWVHLGNHEMQLAELAQRLDARRTHYQRALTFYETAVGVGQLSMPAPFGYAIPWYQSSNRPFLRGLHGLTLTYWALRRLSDAARVAHDTLWLNPIDNTGARYLVEALATGTTYENFKKSST